jgi:transcriptional regulator with XRE-family HTH domain
LLNALVEARNDAGLSQAQLAQRLGKPASFVGKYELGERRLDVVELLVVLKAVSVDSDEIIRKLKPVLPSNL